MATIHEILSFWRGDQWVISGVANDPNGNPLDLSQSGLVLRWMLTDMNGVPFDQCAFGSGVLVVNASSGQFQVIRTVDVTKNIPPGKYQDFLQSIDPVNGPAMQWSGLIQVLDSPFTHQNPLQYGWATLAGAGSLRA